MALPDAYRGVGLSSRDELDNDPDLTESELPAVADTRRL